jgi:hypothetical protein
VYYDDVSVGAYAADLLVQNAVGSKVIRALERIHKAQCLNYLKPPGCLSAY